MGNSSSQRNISIINENLVPVVESSKSDQAGKPGEKKSENKMGSGDQTSSVLSDTSKSPQEHLKESLEPFKKFNAQQSEPAETPAEQKLLMECFKRNSGNTLSCVGEIHDFVNYVNNLPVTQRQQP